MRNLFQYMQTLLAVGPEVSAWFRAATDEGFVNTTETLLSRAVDHLEASRNHLATSGEDGISTAVIGFLNGFGIHASRETNSNGHVDFLVRHQWRSNLIICGEAKIWHGKQYHFGGLDQLLGYMSGRYPHGFLLAYVQTGQVERHMETLEGALNEDLPNEQQGPCERHPTIHWSLYSSHLHSSARVVRVLHIGVNLVC